MLLTEGQLAITAIHRATGGIHQVLHPVVAATLKNVAETYQVALDVGRWVLQGVTHPRLSREVHDGPRERISKKFRQSTAIVNIQLSKAEALGRPC